MQDDKAVLIVEDDKNLNEINRLALETDGWIVYTALNLVQARRLLALHTPDLMMLDVKLPDGTGFDFCKEVRAHEKYASIPILFLTSVSDDSGELEGLRSGGNDYLRKPYSIELLRIRVGNLLKLRESQTLRNVTCGPLTLNAKTMTAHHGGNDMRLSPTEFTLLLHFIQHKGQTVKLEDIYEKVWGQPMNDDPNAVRVMATRLRKRIEGSGYEINAVRGEGYRFEAEV